MNTYMYKYFNLKRAHTQIFLFFNVSKHPNDIYFFQDLKKRKNAESGLKRFHITVGRR